MIILYSETSKYDIAGDFLLVYNRAGVRRVINSELVSVMSGNLNIKHTWTLQKMSLLLQLT